MEYIGLAVFFFLTPIPWLVIHVLTDRNEDWFTRIGLLAFAAIGFAVIFGPIVRDRVL